MRGIWVILSCLLVVSGVETQALDEAAQQAFFEKRIRPVLANQCYECHSSFAKRLKGGLRLDTREATLRGGDSGPALVPHDPANSLLLKALRYEADLEMPPKGALPRSVIADFEQWIANGAWDPRTEPTNTEPSNKNDAPLWSLQPLRAVYPPDTPNDGWARQPLDRFIRSQQAQSGTVPNPDADWPTLLRRLSFDLIGLPPTPATIQHFLQAVAQDPESALEQQVDALLASPQFGERWGRHWLDVARYAESNGKSRDVLFPYAWRYRNWVIDAFNADLPYNAFIQRQIAGDLLPSPNPETRKANQVATGFLAIGSKSLVGGNLQLDLIDDQIDAVTRSFLGLTVSCARCHDHKFDPIPTADYYAIGGIFASTDTRYGGGPRRPKTPADAMKVWLPLGDENEAAVTRLTALVNQRQALTKDQKKAQNRLKKLRNNPDKNQDAIQTLKEELNTLRSTVTQLDEEEGTLKIDYAMGVRDLKKPKDLAIRIRGEKSNTGSLVKRGFLTHLQLPSPAVDRKQSGRIQLAEWITHQDNPLTARVAVNRIWSHLFGRGLVASVDNFGHSGNTPTHPELLDYLARTFQDSGWSTKQLIKHLVTSRTYRLAAQNQPEAYKQDPQNTTYWRFNRRRLEIEPLHDALLQLGQQLNLERPASSVVARIGEGEVGRGINTKPLNEPFRHRGIYLPVLRTAMIDLHKTFDFPDPGNIQGQRDTTNVPTQSLFLLNSPLVIDMAQELSQRITADAQTTPERVTQAYLWIFGRKPNASERAAAITYLEGSTPPAWDSLCQALIASAEFRYLN